VEFEREDYPRWRDELVGVPICPILVTIGSLREPRDEILCELKGASRWLEEGINGSTSWDP